MPTGEKSCRAPRFPPRGIGFSSPLVTVSCAVRGPAVIALPIFSPSADATFPQVTFQVGRVTHRIAVGVIVEVREDVQSPHQVRADSSSLAAQGLRRIVPPLAPAMKTQVHPVGGQLPWVVGN